MKRFVPILVAVAALAASAAATAAPPTMTPGTLVVAFGDPAVGFASGTVRGNTVTNPKGYEVDVAKAVAANLGIPKIKWIYSPWNSLFAPGTKKFDVSFQEATITAQRKRTVDFSTSYFDANQGVLLSKKATIPHSISDLKKLQTCAQTNTTGLDWIKTKLHPNKAPLAYPATTAAFTAVQIGRCDALILDTPIVASERKANPGKYGPVAGQIITHEQYGAVFQKGSKLVPEFNTSIKKLWSNGTIPKLQKKWFAIDFTKVPVLK
ncbi:MAG: amino acid ABC transporter substrate-binding protein [Actinobacteria bacterium]|nr:MAG: amino acid ABC transporter substrate-binding protein [Actinomycetota bacterium]